MKNAKLCIIATDVPPTEHFAILVFGEIFVPGINTLDLDSTEDKNVSTTEYWIFLNKSDWEDAINTLTQHRNTKFLAITAKPAKITSSVTVES